MRLLLSTFPILVYSLLVSKGFFPVVVTSASQKNQRGRKWMFRVLTASLLTMQIGKKGLDTWWGMLILVVSQLLLVEIMEFSLASLGDFSRCLLPSQIGLILMQPKGQEGFNHITVLAFGIRTVSALFVTPSPLEHVAQLAVLVPSIIISQLDHLDEALLTRIALLFCISVLLPLCTDDFANSAISLIERTFANIMPLLESRFEKTSSPVRWGLFSSATCIFFFVLSFIFELNSMIYYELLWDLLALVLFLISLFSWTMSFARSSHLSPSLASSPKPSSNNLSASNSSSFNLNKEFEQMGFLQRAQREDLLTFQAAMSFIHMLLVLFMTSIDLPHLAFVNLVIIASLLFQNHTSQTVHELVSGIVVSQTLSLFVLRFQLREALLVAREEDSLAQLFGVNAVAEQVGLVFCSIRLVAGAILTEDFSRHAAETMLLASVSVYCSNDFSTKYLVLVMMLMSIFASRIKASTVSLAISWLNSEYELRRFMDHELRVSFAGITLALEHCLGDDQLNFSEETVQMLSDALIECKRGKQLCFQATLQRMAYDTAYELHIDGMPLDEGILSYHNVSTTFSPNSRAFLVHTDWNLVNHVLDNAVANSSKYGFNVAMSCSIENVQENGSAMLCFRVTNTPTMDKRYEAVMNMKDNSVLFDYTPSEKEGKSSQGNPLWSLAAAAGGRISSSHIGLPVAKVFANRLGSTLSLRTEPDLVTFSLDVPVFVSERTADQLPQQPHGVSGPLNGFRASNLNHNTFVLPELKTDGTDESVLPTFLESSGNPSTRLMTPRNALLPPFHRRDSGRENALNLDATTLSRSSADSEDEDDGVEKSIPTGLIFASIDDSELIRSTIRCSLYRSLKASPSSIVRGQNAEEAASFAKTVVSLNADICLVDENLDYDDVAIVGSSIVRELRAIGYTGIVVLYSANDNLGKKLDSQLFDGFASKSASRQETKLLLAEIYWRKMSAAHFSALAPSISQGSAKLFVSPKLSLSISLPPFSQKFGGGKKFKLAIVPATIQESQSIRLVDPTTLLIGITSESNVFSFSLLVRIVATIHKLDDQGASLVTSFCPEQSGFDLVCSAELLTSNALDFLMVLSDRSLLYTNRFPPPQLDGPVVDLQQIDRSTLNEFDGVEEQQHMIEIFCQGIHECFERISKRPNLETLRKVAHFIKGSSIQIGARALHQSSSKLEKSCLNAISNNNGGSNAEEEVQRNLCDFVLLMENFVSVSKNIVHEEDYIKV